jgi:hypothetical protein
LQKQVSSIKAFYFQNWFILTLILLALISSALLMTKHQAEWTEFVLEGTFMSYAFFAFWWTKRTEPITGVIIIRWLTFLYVVLSYIYAIGFNNANVFDFLKIYKAFIYLFFLTFLVNKQLMTYAGANRLIIILFSLFILKYVLMIVTHRSDRPIMYMENNFELMFLYALYLIRYTVTKEKYLFLLGLVGLITILSLSRSSLLMYSVLALFVVSDSFKKTRVFIIPGAIIVLGVVAVYIFSQRSSSVQDIDRYRFMLVWWSNVNNWNFFQWMVGAERITALSPQSCSYMNYFRVMFSYKEDGTCYSVVLHSFIFRVLFDHGILGFIALLWTVYYLLVKSKVRKDVTFVFITIVLINGLSVSSFNNLFFAISMVFLMTTNTDRQQLERDDDDDDDEEEEERQLSNKVSIKYN